MMTAVESPQNTTYPTVHSFTPTDYGQPIYGMQTKTTRAINVGGIRRTDGKEEFIPGRLILGTTREELTAQGTEQTLALKPIRDVISRFHKQKISTITVLRETLSCRLRSALATVGIRDYYGDAFIGASHIKGDGAIRTAYLYENIEGLCDRGLWIIADSICIGRNLLATMGSLLSQFHPKELLFISPIASRIGINALGKLTNDYHVPTTFVAWGALFGVDEKTLYDMPWGHKNTEAIDLRDQQTFIDMFGTSLCMGGDFGNDYYCPSIAKKLYIAQLRAHGIMPNIPSVTHILTRYDRSEIAHWEE